MTRFISKCSSAAATSSEADLRRLIQPAGYPLGVGFAIRSRGGAQRVPRREPTLLMPWCKGVQELQRRAKRLILPSPRHAHRALGRHPSRRERGRGEESILLHNPITTEYRCATIGKPKVVRAPRVYVLFCKRVRPRQGPGCSHGNTFGTAVSEQRKQRRWWCRGEALSPTMPCHATTPRIGRVAGTGARGPRPYGRCLRAHDATHCPRRARRLRQYRRSALHCTR
jgi:hypothetical protein